MFTLVCYFLKMYWLEFGNFSFWWMVQWKRTTSDNKLLPPTLGCTRVGIPWNSGYGWIKISNIWNWLKICKMFLWHFNSFKIIEWYHIQGPRVELILLFITTLVCNFMSCIYEQILNFFLFVSVKVEFEKKFKSICL